MSFEKVHIRCSSDGCTIELLISIVIGEGKKELGEICIGLFSLKRVLIEGPVQDVIVLLVCIWIQSSKPVLDLGYH